MASARMGNKTLLLTMNIDTIAQMSCNPAIGGIGKGQLVREIDALGGEMARAIDATYIQFRMLNTKKGRAVWAPRAQADKKAYQSVMRMAVENCENLEVKQEEVSSIVVDDAHPSRRISGVLTKTNMIFDAGSVIVTAGTFMNGLIHVGEASYAAGRIGEPASIGLSDSLRSLGFEIRRFKTGTPARVNARSIDYSQLEVQEGDKEPENFSYSTEKFFRKQVPCHLTYTNETTHRFVITDLDRSPLYSGKIKGIGPRYCPSIEDKVVKFPERIRHQVFLEPEGLNTNEVYLNGLSTSLPHDSQLRILRSIKGLENVEVMKFGYAIEYDYAPPTQLKATLETKLIDGLYFAGQINGTSGYEEAAAQGLLAGINASLKIKGEEPFMPKRSEAYIGVLVDDLVTKGTNEPYRMFTSRAEHRLILRQDNADLRLMAFGYKFGLISKETYEISEKKRSTIDREITRLKNTGSGEGSLAQLLKRTGVRYEDLPSGDMAEQGLSDDIVAQIEISIKYEGYVNRAFASIEKMDRLEAKKIYDDIDYNTIIGLGREAKEKLNNIKPSTLGQAARIPGITPADITILMVYLEGKNRRRQAELVQQALIRLRP